MRRAGRSARWIALSAAILLAACPDAARARERTSFVVQLIEETACWGCCGNGPPDPPEGPLPRRVVHVRIGAWEDSTLADYAGVARFDSLPPGDAAVWCETRSSFARWWEEIRSGATAVVAPGSRAIDTLIVIRYRHASLFR